MAADPTLRSKLMHVFCRMLGRYGRQNWWPGETWFEVMVGAVLTQATSWTNVEKAIANLKSADVLTPPAIREIPQSELAKLIYPSGYYNAKARKLKALAEYIGSRLADDVEAISNIGTEQLREELLGILGIGEETADAILLYAVGKPVFVIDNYTRRIFSRLGVAPVGVASVKDTYKAYRELFTENLQEDIGLFSEYHALIVSHGKDVCKKTPICRNCCLADICVTGKSLLEAN